MIDGHYRTADSIESATCRPKVIYVMGYGRSGSTLLDIMLGNQTGVLSGGELIEFPTWATTDRPCACGARLAECVFWRRVIHDYGRRLSESEAVQRGNGQGLQSRRGLVWQKFSRRRSRGALAWSRSEVALFESLAEVGAVSAVVDSSKSAAGAAGRALALSRLTGLEVRPILLVRDGRAVTRSCARRKGSPERPLRARWPFVRGLRGLIGWSITNALCLLSFRSFRRQPLIVRYENLASQPTRELERVARAVGVDFSEVIERIDRGEALEVRHTLGGNRLRFEDRVTIRTDDGWRTEMSPFWRALCGLAAWPTEFWLRRAERRGRADEGPDRTEPTRLFP